jgi:glyoxylase-like metal-dependent hydrolase (beta-lactamase superfamily II)
MTFPDPVFFTSSILPVRERLVLKGGRNLRIPLRVRIGYFYHPKLGHALIDTGYSRSVVHPKSTDIFLQIYKFLLKPQIINECPLSSGLSRLGLSKSDIDTVIITHFHADHIGGLLNLPKAKVICSEAAWKGVVSKSRIAKAFEGVFETLIPNDLINRLQFVENAGHPVSQTEFGTAYDISGDGTVLCVNLPGHMGGHIGLYFSRPERDFLYATDAQWLLQAIREKRMPGFPVSRIYHDRNEALQSVKCISAFLKKGGELMLCHDPNIQKRDIDDDITSRAIR